MEKFFCLYSLKYFRKHNGFCIDFSLKFALTIKLSVLLLFLVKHGGGGVRVK